MKRYAAKLLFQYRVQVGPGSGKRRLCEERVVLFTAESARRALTAAKQRGRGCQCQHSFPNGNPVFFEFVGVMELLGLDPECEQDEVWYELKERLLPRERKEKLVPPESELNAIRNETKPSPGVHR